MITRWIAGVGACLTLAVGCSSAPSLEEQLASGEPVSFEAASAVEPSGLRPIVMIEGDDDADGVPNLTMLEFQLCCEDKGCAWGEDSSGRKVCQCPAGVFGMISLAAVKVNACVMAEAID
jgi:hypothetical protein